MPPLDAEHYQAWLKMRIRTMIVFIIQSVLIGMDTSLTFLTLYMYLKKQIQSDMPLLYYSLISVSYFLPSIVLSAWIGNLADRYRNVRLVFFVINTLTIVGNLIYALPFSPWLLMVGRLLCGVGASLRSVMAGEVARSYPPHVMPNKMAYLGLSFSAGYVVGPAINVIFTNFNATIGCWTLTFYNIPGVYMALLFSVVQIMSVSMLYNLSKIYDLKMEVFEDSKDHAEVTFLSDMIEEDKILLSDEDEQNCSSALDEESTVFFPDNSKSDTSHPSTISTLKRMLCNFDIALMLLLAFLLNYLDMCYFMWNPLLVVEKLKWSIDALSWIMIGMGVTAVFTCIFFIYCTISDKFIYHTAVLIPLALTLLQVMSTTFYYYHGNLVFYISLWVVYCLLYTFIFAAQEVVLVTTIAKFVSSRYQVFADGIRLTMFRSGGVVALSISAFIYQRMDIISVIHISLMFFLFWAINFKTEDTK